MAASTACASGFIEWLLPDSVIWFFYKIDLNTVIVFRILPGRRDPNWIRAALRIPGKKK